MGNENLLCGRINYCTFAPNIWNHKFRTFFLWTPRFALVPYRQHIVCAACRLIAIKGDISGIPEGNRQFEQAGFIIERAAYFRGCFEQAQAGGDGLTAPLCGLSGLNVAQVWLFRILLDAYAGKTASSIGCPNPITGGPTVRPSGWFAPSRKRRSNPSTMPQLSNCAGMCGIGWLPTIYQATQEFLLQNAIRGHRAGLEIQTKGLYRRAAPSHAGTRHLEWWQVASQQIPSLYVRDVISRPGTRPLSSCRYRSR